MVASRRILPERSPRPLNAAAGLLSRPLVPWLGPGSALLLGALASVAAQVGDLVESLLKTKDPTAREPLSARAAA